MIRNSDILGEGQGREPGPLRVTLERRRVEPKGLGPALYDIRDPAVVRCRCRSALPLG
jgi:hypothetical protein